MNGARGRNLSGARHDQGQWSWPKGFGQGICQRWPIRNTAPGHFQTRDVDDDRVARRPAFDLENALHGPSIQRIGGQAINGFGWESDHLPGAQQVRRSTHCGLKEFRGVGRKNLCLNPRSHCLAPEARGLRNKAAEDSPTSRRRRAPSSASAFRKVLECGCPLPLSIHRTDEINCIIS